MNHQLPSLHHAIRKLGISLSDRLIEHFQTRLTPYIVQPSVNGSHYDCLRLSSIFFLQPPCWTVPGWLLLSSSVPAYSLSRSIHATTAPDVSDVPPKILLHIHHLTNTLSRRRSVLQACLTPGFFEPTQLLPYPDVYSMLPISTLFNYFIVACLHIGAATSYWSSAMSPASPATYQTTNQLHSLDNGHIPNI